MSNRAADLLFGLACLAAFMALPAVVAAFGSRVLGWWS